MLINAIVCGIETLYLSRDSTGVTYIYFPYFPTECLYDRWRPKVKALRRNGENWVKDKERLTFRGEDEKKRRWGLTVRETLPLNFSRSAPFISV